MTPAQIIEKAESLGPWYHEIALTHGYVTPSVMKASRPIWDMTRRVRSKLDYSGKAVLDLGTFDGMWAFEAERLGAASVVACDIWQAATPSPLPLERFLFARRCLGSKAWPVTNGDAHYLTDRLADAKRVLGIKAFDIVQNLGMLYHLENPLLALSEIRKQLEPKGAMLLETAAWTGGSNAPTVRLNSDNGVYYDQTTFWVPNIPALQGMLGLTGFKPRKFEVVDQLPNREAIRVCAICDLA